MKIIRFELSHLEELNVWLTKRDIAPVLPKSLPKVGFLLLNEEKPIAAVFLRRVEGEGAILDSLVTDPDEPSHIRHKALDLLVDHAVLKASELGLKNLIAFTRDASTLVRSFRHGFKQAPFSLIELDLTHGEL